MPIRYERDNASRRVLVTVEGGCQTDDVLAIVARRRADGTWTFGTLCDLRNMTERPTLVDLRQIASEAAARESDEGARGPVALLATEGAPYAMACMYAALQQSTLTIEVFRALDEAEHWLAGQLDARTMDDTKMREGDIVVTRVVGHYALGRLKADGLVQTPLEQVRRRSDALNRACQLAGIDHRVFILENSGSGAYSQFDCAETPVDSTGRGRSHE